MISTNRPQRTRNLEVGIAPRIGPAMTSVKSAPAAVTRPSDTSRPRRVEVPLRTVVIVDDRYPPTISAITTRNETLPLSSPSGSGWA